MGENCSCKRLKRVSHEYPEQRLKTRNVLYIWMSNILHHPTQIFRLRLVLVASNAENSHNKEKIKTNDIATPRQGDKTLRINLPRGKTRDGLF